VFERELERKRAEIRDIFGGIYDDDDDDDE